MSKKEKQEFENCVSQLVQKMVDSKVPFNPQLILSQQNFDHMFDSLQKAVFLTEIKKEQITLELFEKFNKIIAAGKTKEYYLPLRSALMEQFYHSGLIGN